jgi:hypothetical protein
VNKCPTATNDTIKCKPTSRQPDCPKNGTLYPSTAWFGECAPVQNDAMSEWTADEKLGYAYLEQNHDKHYSFLLDFINNGLQLFFMAISGLILNFLFVFLMSKWPNVVGMVALFIMEFLQFVIVLAFLYFAVRGEDVVRNYFIGGAILFTAVGIIFNCLLYCFWD